MNYRFNDASFNYVDCIDYTKAEAIERLIKMSIEKAMSREAPAIQYVIIDIFEGGDESNNFYYVHIHPTITSYQKHKRNERTVLTDGMHYAGNNAYALIKTDTVPEGYGVQRLTTKMVDILHDVEIGLKEGYIGVINSIANNPANYGG